MNTDRLREAVKRFTKTAYANGDGTWSVPGRSLAALDALAAQPEPLAPVELGDYSQPEHFGPEPLDVERLARALHGWVRAGHLDVSFDDWDEEEDAPANVCTGPEPHLQDAAAIAAEYAALSETPR